MGKEQKEPIDISKYEYKSLETEVNIDAQLYYEMNALLQRVVTQESDTKFIKEEGSEELPKAVSEISILGMSALQIIDKLGEIFVKDIEKGKALPKEEKECMD